MTAIRRAARFTSVLEESRNRLWGAHFGVPAAVATRLLEERSRRILCTLNGSVEYPTALIPRGDGTYVIRVNKSIRVRLGLTSGNELEVLLKRDESRYGLPMPEELEEVLRQDAEGRRFFNNLTAGRKRTLLHLVGSAVPAETRIRRAVVVVRHLRSNRGTIDYKELNRLLRRG